MDACLPRTSRNFYQRPAVAGELPIGHAWKGLGSKPGTPGLTCKRAGPGCHAPHLLHFGHIPDEGFIVHIGEQFAQLVQV